MKSLLKGFQSSRHAPGQGGRGVRSIQSEQVAKGDFQASRQLGLWKNVEPDYC